MSYDTCNKTFVTFRVYSDALPPDEITEFLQVEPTATHVKGERRASRSTTELHETVNGWFVSSEEHVASVDSEVHLDWLFDRMAPAQERLAALRSRGVKMDISCFWDSKHGHGGPTVSASTAARLANLGVDLWFDIYLP